MQRVYTLIWGEAGPVLWRWMHQRLLNRQTTSGSGSPWPPTGFGYRPVLCTYPVLTHPWTVTSSHRGRTPISVRQKPKRLYGYTDIHSKLLFLYLKALQQDAELKKKQTINKTKPNPKQVVGNGLFNSWISGFPSDTQIHRHSASFISLPPPCPGISPYLSLSSCLPILPADKPSLLCLRDFNFLEEKSEGINQTHYCATISIIELRLVSMVS